MTYLVDTNIFLRVLIAEDECSHRECVELVQCIKENKIQALVPGVVLAEMVWVLQSFYGFSKEKTVSGVQGVLNIRGLSVIENVDYAQALVLFSQKNVKFIDACLASVAQEEDLGIISYDKDFNKLAVRKLEPKDVLRELRG